MEYKPHGSRWGLLFVKCECMPPWACAPIGNTTRLHAVCLPKTLRPARLRQLDTDRHTTATPLGGPTRYDLHLRDGTERERKTRTKKKRAGEREMKKRGRAPVCLLWLACFSLVLNFDRLRLLLGSVSLLSHGQGRRDDTPSLGKGARGLECWGGWVARRRGLVLTGGYKYPRQPNVNVRNWWKSSGGTLHLPHGDTPHKHRWWLW